MPTVPDDDGPGFDNTLPHNVTALVGKSAFLGCKVKRLGNRTVSWIRHRDIHILTVGTYTYTTDQRFQTMHRKDSDEWTLQIRFAQKRDIGLYECQVSTRPIRMWCIYLNVILPAARIVGGPDIHVDVGSRINLTCVVKYGPEPPAYIFWYHNEDIRAINFDSQRGGIHVVVQKGELSSSSLILNDARLNDSGRYTCSPSNADVATAVVHVLQGESPAAMHTGTVKTCTQSIVWLMVGFIIYYANGNNLLF